MPETITIAMCIICGESPALVYEGKPPNLCATCWQERFIKVLCGAESRWHRQRGRDKDHTWRLGERHRRWRRWQRRTCHQWRRIVEAAT